MLVLNLYHGLNLIVGQSNNGKSATLRGIESAVYNVSGTDSVRHGASNYLVGLEYKGNTVAFQKGASTTYMINGKRFGKAGREIPVEVSEALNMRELSVNGKNERLNFWKQMDKPFLLDRTPTELFRFIVDSRRR